MAFTVKMVLLDKLADAEAGFLLEPIQGSYPTVDAANRAGDAEIKRRAQPPGSITYRVYNDAGQEVDETGMGLS